VKARISGIGTWLPPAVRRNSDWPESFSARTKAGERTFNDIEAPGDARAASLIAADLAREASDPFIGSVLRHVADESTTATEAESCAALSALADAGVRPEEVDVVLGNSMVPDRVAPLSGPSVAHRIGARRAHAISVDTVCASAVSQLEIAKAYVESGMARHVLLVQSHLMLRTIPMTHPASPGLGDGASALVVSADRGGLVIRSTFGITHGQEAMTVTWVRGTDDATDTPWWKAGGEARLGSRAPDRVKALMRDTVKYGSDTIRAAADRAGISAKDLDVVVSVQPRGFIPPAIAEHLGLPRQRAVETYERIAHVGVCGPVFNLAAARDSGRLPRGARVAMYAQGAGFTRATAVLEVEP
jgi:3-oxoacyl-[acyl-carrier-protein] synthase-3